MAVELTRPHTLPVPPCVTRRQNIHADYGVASATLEEMAAGMGGAAGAPQATTGANSSWGGSSGSGGGAHR
jgi:hypothetical protein